MTKGELDDTAAPGTGVPDGSSDGASVEAAGAQAAEDSGGDAGRPADRTPRTVWGRRRQSLADPPPDPEDAPIGSGVLDAGTDGSSQALGMAATSGDSGTPSWPDSSWTASPGAFRLTAPDDLPTDGDVGWDEPEPPSDPGSRAFPPSWARRPAIVAAGAIGGVLVLAIALVLGPLRPTSATAVLPTVRPPAGSPGPTSSLDPGVAARRDFLARIVDPTFTYRMVWSGRVAGPGDRGSFKGTYDVAGRDYSARMAVAGRGTTRIIFKGRYAYTKRGSRAWTRVSTGYENLRQYPFLGIARPGDIAYVGPVQRPLKVVPAGSLPAASPASPGLAPSEAPASGSAGPSASPQPQEETLYLLRSTGSYRPNRERILNMTYLRWPTNRILLEVLVRADDGTPVSATFRLEAGGTRGNGKPQFVGTATWTFSRIGVPVVVKAPGS